MMEHTLSVHQCKISISAVATLSSTLLCSFRCVWKLASTSEAAKHDHTSSSRVFQTQSILLQNTVLVTIKIITRILVIQLHFNLVFHSILRTGLPSFKRYTSIQIPYILVLLPNESPHPNIPGFHTCIVTTTYIVFTCRQYEQFHKSIVEKISNEVVQLLIMPYHPISKTLKDLILNFIVKNDYSNYFIFSYLFNSIFWENLQSKILRQTRFLFFLKGISHSE